jgi:hypothetical protein
MTQIALPDQEKPAGLALMTEDTRQRSPAHPPVFLHCAWRTRGTWIWNRFRGMPGVTGYYEPLAERLAGLRPNTLQSINAESWSSGHKGLDRPYYAEFRPLLRPGVRGVPFYRTQFATHDFFAAPDEPLPGLEHYLWQLLRAARQQGEQPVLKFCRSLGRIGWMRRHFPDAVHIVVTRDPFSQFSSSLDQYVREGNAYFLAMPLLLLAMNRDLPLIDRCVRHLDVELPDLADPRTALATCQAWLGASTLAAWYRVFLAFWTAAAATMPDGVDLVIDSDALARASAYRLRCSFDLARLTGRMPDFSDADCSQEARTPGPSLLRRSDALRAHAAAEAFLAEQVGEAWADTRALGHIAGKLAEARSHAIGVDLPRPSTNNTTRPFPSRDPDFEAALLSAMARAALAERETAAMRSSRSWRVTAPLRWLRQSLG